MAGKDPRNDKEKPEGSRGTVDEALENAAHGSDEDSSKRERPGITNRPAAEEEEQQRQLPPRGEAKRDG